MEEVERYPCSACDYIFTLLLSLAYGLVLSLSDVPWWMIVAIVHFQTASWFLKTRSNERLDSKQRMNPAQAVQ